MCLICSVYRSQEARKDPLDERGEEELSGEQTEKTRVTCKVDEAQVKDKGKKEVGKLQGEERFKG